MSAKIALHTLLLEQSPFLRLGQCSPAGHMQALEKSNKDGLAIRLLLLQPCSLLEAKLLHFFLRPCAGNSNISIMRKGALMHAVLTRQQQSSVGFPMREEGKLT